MLSFSAGEAKLKKAFQLKDLKAETMVREEGEGGEKCDSNMAG